MWRRWSENDRLARTRNEMSVVRDLQMITQGEIVELTGRREIAAHRNAKRIGDCLFLQLASSAILIRSDQRRRTGEEDLLRTRRRQRTLRRSRGTILLFEQLSDQIDANLGARCDLQFTLDQRRTAVDRIRRGKERGVVDGVRRRLRRQVSHLKVTSPFPFSLSHF